MRLIYLDNSVSRSVPLSKSRSKLKPPARLSALAFHTMYEYIVTFRNEMRLLRIVSYEFMTGDVQAASNWKGTASTQITYVVFRAFREAWHGPARA